VRARVDGSAGVAGGAEPGDGRGRGRGGGGQRREVDDGGHVRRAGAGRRVHGEVLLLSLGGPFSGC
jgi:hypothetical protein